MNRYANAKLYKLVNNVDDEFYVGSTCMPLPKRYYGHKSAAVQKPDRRVYEHLNMVGWDNVQIIQVEAYPCNTKEELLARERYWVETLKPILNQQIPGRTKQEYRMENKEMEIQQRKEYYAKHRDEVLERGAAYKARHKERIAASRNEVVTCDCGMMSTIHHLLRHQQSKKHKDTMEEKEFVETFTPEVINNINAYVC